MTCYDLISVYIEDEQVLARPIAWDREIYDIDGNDVRGNPVKATEFHTTCPHCGDLVHFIKDEILIVEDEKDKREKGNVQCAECGAGRKLVVTEDGTPQPIVAVQVEFLDPIAEGLFDVEIDQDLFEKVENLAESD